MIWRVWIKRYGIKKLSKKLGVSYELVRLWANSTNVPSDDYKRKLVEMCSGEFGYSEFFKG